MQISSMRGQYKSCFGINYKLSDETIKIIENSTGLTYNEMTSLTIEDAKALMEQRGIIKEPRPFKEWLINKYKQIGEKLGFIEKKYNTYTDVD